MMERPGPGTLSVHADRELNDSGSVAPPIEEPLGDGNVYQVFLSHRGQKLNGSGGTLHICGIKSDDDA